MIVVLADDFSGAAEIAGIAFRFGLTVELRTDASPESTTDVLVVDTDTRSYSHAKAKTEFNLVLSRLKQMNPTWIYKKTDSVMRGPVLEEIIETMNVFNKKLCLLLPANPEKNRIISNGHYFIDGDLLNYTAFAHDPEYPAKTADVLELLGESKQIASCVRKADQQLPNEGIVICEAENTVDVQKWTEKWTENSLAAGGAEFFEGLLSREGYQAKSQTNLSVLPPNKTVLCVWGSSIKKNKQIYNQFKKKGFQIVEIPIPMETSDLDSFVNEYTEISCDKLKSGRIILTFVSKTNQRYEFLTDLTVQIVKQIVSIQPIDEMFIEGGSTASAFVRKMDWDHFVPTDELIPGVVRLKVESQSKLYLTVKPGSYPWPANFI